MADGPLRRRTLLRATGVAVGTAALAGCPASREADDDGEPADGGTGDAESGDGEPGDSEPVDVAPELDVVPSLADGVLVADVAALRADDALQVRLDRVTSTLRPLTYADDSAVQLSGIEDVTLFASAKSWEPTGARLSAGWSEAAVRGALERYPYDLPTERYAGHIIHVTDRDTAGLAALGDGAFVTGTLEAVEAAIDVETGATEPLDGPVRDAFAKTPGGPLRFAFTYPHWAVDFEAIATPAGVHSLDRETRLLVSRGRGAYVVDGDERHGSVTLETDSADAANTLAGEIDDALTVARETVPADPGQDGAAASLSRRTPFALSVDVDGPAVTIDVADGEVLPLLLASGYSQALAPGPGTDLSRPRISPQAIFEFSYDDTTGTLTITHTSGESIVADRLSIRGRGITAVDGVDQTSAGPWAGDASGSIGGRQAVRAGDRVTVGVAPDYVVRLEWSADEDATLAVLDVDSGPDF